MEAEPDNFLKVLQKRQRNLTKKLDRIRKKQAEAKANNKELKDEERKMLESAPQVEELLAETERLIQQYQKHVGGPQKEVKKPQSKPEDDRVSEMVHLWLLGEFLRNPQIKERFVRENANVNDLEAFLLLHSQAKGQTGETLSETISIMMKSVELYLSKSAQIAPGTMRSYKNLSEFATIGLTWCLNQQRPHTPVKSELKVQAGPVYSTQNKPEKKQIYEVEEVKVEVKQEVKPIYEEIPKTSWADDTDDAWGGEEQTEEVVNKSNKKAEDEGFIEVTGRKPKTAPKEHHGDDRGRRRGGRGGGRGRRYREGPRNN